MVVRYSDEEYAAVLALAAAARRATAAYVAEVSLTPPTVAARGGSEQLADALLELMGTHRQLRGACTNLNQAVKAFNSTGEAPSELAEIARYVRRVTDHVDEVIALMARRGDPR